MPAKTKQKQPTFLEAFDNEYTSHVLDNLSQHMSKLKSLVKNSAEWDIVMPMQEQVSFLKMGIDNGYGPIAGYGLILDPEKAKQIGVKLAAASKAAVSELSKRMGDEKNEPLLAAINDANLTCKKILLMNSLRVAQRSFEDALLNPKLPADEVKKVKSEFKALLKTMDELGYKWLYKEPAKSRMSDEQFKKETIKLTQKFEAKFKGDSYTWKKVPPIIKGILGVLAAITVIPAVLVQTLTKKGYTKTFFQSHEKKDKSKDKSKLLEMGEPKQHRK